MRSLTLLVLQSNVTFIEHDLIINKLSKLYSAFHCDKDPVSYIVKIGKRDVCLYAFHFALDSQAYESKNPTSKLLTLIENDERQVLRKWTIKASIIVSFSRNVSHCIYSVCLFNCIIILNTNNNTLLCYRIDAFTFLIVPCDVLSHTHMKIH